MLITVEKEQRPPDYSFLSEGNAVGAAGQELRNEGEKILGSSLDSEFLRLRVWRRQVQLRLFRFTELKDNWDSYGAPAPDDTALKSALRISELMRSSDLESANIIPSAEGGIGFCFSEGDRYADIECSNDGEFLGVRYAEMEPPILIEIDGTDGSIKTALEEIRKHFCA